MNMKSLLSELLILASGAVFAAEPFGIYGLNADWRFAKATKPIPDWLVDKAFEWANGDAKKARNA